MKLNLLGNTLWLLFPSLFLAETASARLFQPARRTSVVKKPATTSSAVDRKLTSLTIHKLYTFDEPGGLAANGWIGYNSGPPGGVIVDDLTRPTGSNKALAFTARYCCITSAEIYAIDPVPAGSDMTFRYYTTEGFPDSAAVVSFSNSNYQGCSFTDARFVEGRAYDGYLQGNEYYEDKWLICQVQPVDNYNFELQQVRGPLGGILFDDIVIKQQGSTIPYFGCSPPHDGENCCKTLEEFYYDVILPECGGNSEDPGFLDCVNEMLDTMVAEYLIKEDERQAILDMVFPDTIPFPDRTGFPEPCLNLPPDRIHDDTPQQGWELVPFCDGECIHGYEADVSVDMPLQFPFTLLGETFSIVTVWSNGLICFGALGCIAAYLSNVDTSTPQMFNVNHIWYSSGPHGFSVVWDHVTGSGLPTDQYNTFQVLISDGQAETMGDSNVCTCYDTMEWGALSSSMEGGSSAEAGFVGAIFNGIPFVDIGTFVESSGSYDGPDFQSDGLNFLEDRAICYNVESLLLPPIAVGFPDFPEGSSTYQLEACGSPDELHLSFYFIPGQEGVSIYEVVVNGNVPEGMLLEVIPVGKSYFVYLSWENIPPVDSFELEFVARDDQVPSLSTSKTIYVQVEDKCSPIEEEIDPTTISPTTVAPVVEEIEEVTVASTTVAPTTEEPTEEPSTASPTEEGICDDELGTAFDVVGHQKGCAWLRARLDTPVGTDDDIPNVPAEWVDGVTTWSHVLCGDRTNPGVAYRICSESCGRCEDDCVDKRVFNEVDGGGELGAERTCQWLWTHESEIDYFCNDAVSNANSECPETCGTCDEEDEANDRRLEEQQSFLSLYYRRALYRLTE